MSTPSIAELTAFVMAEAAGFRDRWAGGGRRVVTLRTHGRTTPANLFVAAHNSAYYVGVGELGMAVQELRIIADTLRDRDARWWETDQGGLPAAIAALVEALEAERARAA